MAKLIKKKGGKTTKRKLMAQVHIAKKELGLDDGTYRDLLERVTEKTSTKGMKISELRAVVGEMRVKGWSSRKSASPNPSDTGKKPNVTAHRQALVGKIEAIILDMGLNWEYVRGMAEKMFKKQYEHARVIEWLDDEKLYKLTQALVVYQVRMKEKNS